VLTHLDLFSGIGGFALAARWVGGIRTIGFCEIEDYGCRTLEKNFPGIPIYKDVRELHPDELISRDGRIDFLTAGFPCQDLSVAGNQAGIEADRSGLFFQITRLSDEIYAYCGTRPSLVLENVSNLLAGAGGSWARTVYGELACRGYCIEWKVVGAKDVGAPHRRLRWWAVCYMAHSRHSEPPGWDQGEEGQQSGRGRKAWGESSSCSGSVADSNRKGMEGGKDTGGSCENWKKSYDEYPFRCNKTLPYSNRNGFDQRRKSVTKTGSNGSFRNPGGSTERGLGGVVDGIPNWLDEPGDIPRVTTGQKNRVARLKGLGNAVVPQVAMIPLMRLKEILK